MCCVPLTPCIEELPPLQRRALRAALGLRDGNVPDSFAVGVGTLGLFASAAERSPVLCVFDDLQWTDSPSPSPPAAREDNRTSGTQRFGWTRHRR